MVRAVASPRVETTTTGPRIQAASRAGVEATAGTAVEARARCLRPGRTTARRSYDLDGTSAPPRDNFGAGERLILVRT